MSHRCYIGLGSNLGDSQSILQHAVKSLSLLGEIRVSKLYASPPMGPQDQPDYLNAVVELQTTMLPVDLLDQLQRIENESGRVRLRRWGERTLDLDLLLYADQSIEHERLIVPHVGLKERDFVVLPLLDLVADLIVQNESLKDLTCIQTPSARCVAELDWFLV